MMGEKLLRVGFLVVVLGSIVSAFSLPDEIELLQLGSESGAYKYRAKKLEYAKKDHYADPNGADPCGALAKKKGASGSATWTNRHCYLVFKDKKSFGEANDSCGNLGGYLASITNEEESSMLGSALGSKIPSGGAWIGYSNVLHESHWRWLSGEIPVDGNGIVYSNWAGGSPRQGNNCALLKDSSMVWADDKCPGSRGYVCELEYLPASAKVSLKMPKWDDQVAHLVSYLKKRVKSTEKKLMGRLTYSDRSLKDLRRKSRTLSMELLKVKSGIAEGAGDVSNLLHKNTQNEQQFASFISETKPKLDSLERQVGNMKSLLDRVESETKKLEADQVAVQTKQQALEKAQREQEEKQDAFKGAEHTYKEQAKKSFDETMTEQKKHRDRLAKMSRKLKSYVLSMKRLQSELRNKFLQHVNNAKEEIDEMRTTFGDDVDSLERMMVEANHEAVQVKAKSERKRADAQKMVCKCDPSVAGKHSCECTLCSNFKYGVQDLYPQTGIEKNTETQNLLKKKRAQAVLDNCSDVLAAAHTCGTGSECKDAQVKAMECIGFEPPEEAGPVDTGKRLQECASLIDASKICVPNDSPACKELSSHALHCLGMSVANVAVTNSATPPSPAPAAAPAPAPTVAPAAAAAAPAAAAPAATANSTATTPAPAAPAEEESVPEDDTDDDEDEESDESALDEKNPSDATKLCQFSGAAYLKSQRGSVNLGGEMSFSAWVSVTTSTQWRTLLSTEDRGKGYLISIAPSGKVGFFRGNRKWDFSDRTVLTDGSWTHIAVTFDGHKASFFINGKESGTATRLGDYPDSESKSIYIGRQGEQCNCKKFVGLLSNVQLYSTVLSHSQVEAIYNGKLISHGLIGFWRLTSDTDDSARNHLPTVLVGQVRWLAQATNPLPPTLTK